MCLPQTACTAVHLRLDQPGVRSEGLLDVLLTAGTWQGYAGLCRLSGVWAVLVCLPMMCRVRLAGHGRKQLQRVLLRLLLTALLACTTSFSESRLRLRRKVQSQERAQSYAGAAPA